MSNSDTVNIASEGTAKITIGAWTAFWRIAIIVLTGLAAAAPLVIWALMDSHNDLRYLTKAEHIMERANDMQVSEIRDRMAQQMMVSMQSDLARVAASQEKMSEEVRRINRNANP